MGRPDWIAGQSNVGSAAPSWLRGAPDIYGAYNVAKGELGAAPDVMGAYNYARGQMRGAPDVYGAYNLAEGELHPTADVLGTYGQLRNMMPNRGTLDDRRFEDPFDVSAMRERGKSAIEYQMREQAMPAILEAMGTRGNRYSTSANEAVIRQQGLMGLELEKLYSPMELQAYEGAAGREVAMREIAGRLEQGDQQGATAALNAWTQAQEGAASRAAQLAGQGLNLWGSLEDSARNREGQLINNAMGIWGTTQNADLERRARMAEQGLGLWSAAQESAAQRAMTAGENWANRDLTSQESLANRQFQGGENWANRQFQGQESYANRDFQGGENWANRDLQSQIASQGHAATFAQLMAQLGMQDYQRRNPSDVELSQMAMQYFNRNPVYTQLVQRQPQFDQGITAGDFMGQLNKMGIFGKDAMNALFGDTKQPGLLSMLMKGGSAAGGSMKDLYNWLTGQGTPEDMSDLMQGQIPYSDLNLNPYGDFTSWAPDVGLDYSQPLDYTDWSDYGMDWNF
jgi:hypothetical protein